MQVLMMLQPTFQASEAASEAQFEAFEAALRPKLQACASKTDFEIVDYMGDHLCCRVWAEVSTDVATQFASACDGHWDSNNGIWNVFVTLRGSDEWTAVQRQDACDMCRPLASDTTVDEDATDNENSQLEFIVYHAHQLHAICAILQSARCLQQQG